MDIYHPIAWFYWDPPREAFTIPFFDHPVFWYGVLFVTGFILAYFIVNPILARFLIKTRQISSFDILNWPSLIDTLRHSSSPLVYQLFQQFNPAIRQQLKQKELLPITTTFQQGILEGCNRLLQDSSVSHEDLQQLFGPSLASSKQTAYLLTDRLLWFVVTGTIVGARLGAVLFYDWPYFSQHPLEIFKVWHGGLASHGGFLGVMLSLYLYAKYIQRWIPQLTFLRLLDYVAIPTTLVCCFIRLGNFMNQEILGTPTTLPWGVLFGHPAENQSALPRHPVQLYEAGAYLLLFCIVWQLWKKQTLENRPGAMMGFIFIFGFTSRFLLEFWKANQESILNSSFIQMGQLLSLPFIALGIFLMWYSKYSCCGSTSLCKKT